MTNSRDARPPSEILPERIEGIRRRRQWTQQQLADRMNSIGNGAKVDRSTIAKIESQRRGVTIDEVFWFAVALDVSPLALLLPTSSEDQVTVAPGFFPMSGSVLISWVRGVQPLIGRISDGGPAVRFFAEQRPDYEVAAERRLPGVLRLVEMADGIVATVAENKPGKEAKAVRTGDRGAVWALDALAEMAATLRDRLRRERGWA